MVDHGEGQWSVPITDRAVGGGRGSLFGGVGLAVGVAAMELETGQPAVWATAQYIATMYNPSEMQLDVTKPAVGRTVTQCRVNGAFDGNVLGCRVRGTGVFPPPVRIRVAVVNPPTGETAGDVAAARQRSPDGIVGTPTHDNRATHGQRLESL